MGVKLPGMGDIGASCKGFPGDTSNRSKTLKSSGSIDGGGLGSTLRTEEEEEDDDDEEEEGGGEEEEEEVGEEGISKNSA